MVETILFSIFPIFFKLVHEPHFENTPKMTYGLISFLPYEKWLRVHSIFLINTGVCASYPWVTLTLKKWGWQRNHFYKLPHEPHGGKTLQMIWEVLTFLRVLSELEFNQRCFVNTGPCSIQPHPTLNFCEGEWLFSTLLKWLHEHMFVNFEFMMLQENFISLSLWWVGSKTKMIQKAKTV